MMTSRYNYYEILELKTNAPQHEVTTAYQRAKSTYAGENPAIYTIFSEQEARELLTLIEEAYSVLGNKTLRSIYDEKLLGGGNIPADLSYQSILTASKAFLPKAKAVETKTSYKVDDKFEEEISKAEVWDGALLKKVREYRCVTIERLSERTKINGYYISAIEEMDASNLPALVFVRGYVLQVAKELGLKEKFVADAYMKTFKEKNPHK